MQPDCDFDVLIIGGGMVGATLAVALSDCGWRIGLVEAVAGMDAGQTGYDERGLVMSPASQRIFAGVGLWSGLATESCPVERIHVSEQGRFAFARLSAKELGVEALGHIIVPRHLGQVLEQRMREQNNLQRFCPATFDSLHSTDNGYRVSILQDGHSRELHTRLLVAADGAQSPLRQALDIEALHKDYGQTAIVANVTPTRPHRNTAWERFTRSGPLALLPLNDGHCVSVSAVARDRADALLALCDDDYLEYLEQAFGHRLGRFSRLGHRRSYPLHLVHARERIATRAVLIGNAVHAIHPNAAQGLNLGLRDVALLAELLLDASRNAGDPGSESLLQQYDQGRRQDEHRVVSFSDGLTRLFYNDSPVLGPLRRLGLLAFDRCPAAKRHLSRIGMGLHGQQPRLVRGLPL